MLLRPRADYGQRIAQAHDALLVLEISDGTLGFDQTTKLSLYARHGIEEYWVVDVAGQCIHVYRDPIDDEYAERIEASGNMLISPRTLPQLRLMVRDIFA